jgi:uncharacterized membrane protein
MGVGASKVLFKKIPMKPIDNSLAAFLAQIEATLGDMPAERRAEILAETRCHLEAMLAARRIDGITESAAWEDVQRSFGDPEQIGRDLAREWNRDPHFETIGKPMTQREKAVKVIGGSSYHGLLLYAYGATGHPAPNLALS